MAALAVADGPADAVGVVQLACEESTLALTLLRAGAYRPDFVPGTLAEAVTVHIPYSAVRGLVRRSRALVLTLDRSVPTPFHRFALARFTDDPAETLAPVHRAHRTASTLAWALPGPLGALAAALPPTDLVGGAIGRASTALLTAIAIGATMRVVAAWLAWGGPSSDRLRERFEVAISERLGLMPPKPLPATKPQRPPRLPARVKEIDALATPRGSEIAEIARDAHEIADLSPAPPAIHVPEVPTEDAIAEIARTHLDAIAEIARNAQASIAEISRAQRTPHPGRQRARQDTIAEAARAHQDTVAEIARARQDTVAEAAPSQRDTLADILRGQRSSIADITITDLDSLPDGARAPQDTIDLTLDPSPPVNAAPAPRNPFLSATDAEHDPFATTEPPRIADAARATIDTLPEAARAADDTSVEIAIPADEPRVDAPRAEAPRRLPIAATPHLDTRTPSAPKVPWLRHVALAGVAAASVVAALAFVKRYGTTSARPQPELEETVAVERAPDVPKPPPPPTPPPPPREPRCVCERAASSLWADGMPVLSVMTTTGPDGTIAEPTPRLDEHENPMFGYDVAIVNNSALRIRETRIVLTYARRNEQNQRVAVTDRGLYWGLPLAPGAAVKWTTEGPGTEVRIDKSEEGTLESRKLAPAPADAFFQLLRARHRVVRLQGATMLAYLHDPRAESAVEMIGAPEPSEAPRIRRLRAAARPLVACDLQAADGQLTACVFNASMKPAAGLTMREISDDEAKPGRSFPVAPEVPVHDGVVLKWPLEGDAPVDVIVTDQP